MQWRENKKFSR